MLWDDLNCGGAPCAEVLTARDKEFALKHALVAVLAAAIDLGVGDQVIAKATAGIVSDDPRYRWLQQSHLKSPLAEIEQTAGWIERQSG